MPPEPVVLSCLGTSPGLKGFGLPVTLPAGPIFPETGDAVTTTKTDFSLVISNLNIQVKWLKTPSPPGHRQLSLSVTFLSLLLTFSLVLTTTSELVHVRFGLCSHTAKRVLWALSFQEICQFYVSDNFLICKCSTKIKG